MGLAVELDQLLEHDGSGGHVDAEREGFSGEHRPNVPGHKQFLDDLAERRQHAGMVRGEPARYPLGEVPVPENREVVVSQPCRALLHELAVALPLRRSDEP